MKKIYCLAIYLLFTSITLADTCPSVNEIHMNNLHGWKLYDSEDGTPLTGRREVLFRKNAEQFVLAEWPNSKNKNSTMHCYYRDHDGSDFEAYLAKNNFAPENSFKYWYKVTGNLQCAAGSEKCRFKSNLSNTQLAAR